MRAEPAILHHIFLLLIISSFACSRQQVIIFYFFLSFEGFGIYLSPWLMLQGKVGCPFFVFPLNKTRFSCVQQLDNVLLSACCRNITKGSTASTNKFKLSCKKCSHTRRCKHKVVAVNQTECRMNDTRTTALESHNPKTQE